MEAGSLIVVSAALIVVIICVALLLTPEYDDGIFGRIALWGLSSACGVPLIDHFVHHVIYEILPTTMLLYVSVALFMIRHFCRFQKYATPKSMFSRFRNLWRRVPEARSDSALLVRQLLWLAAILVFLVYYTVQPQ